MQFSLVIGGVVPVVNLAGIAPGRLKFTGELLAAIYPGKVTNWNDPAIASPNPGIDLPNLKITAMHPARARGRSPPPPWPWCRAIRGMRRRRPRR